MCPDYSNVYSISQCGQVNSCRRVCSLTHFSTLETIEIYKIYKYKESNRRGCVFRDTDAIKQTQMGWI